MSNFCQTNYCFEGDSNCLRDFYGKMKKLHQDESIEDYRERHWMTRLASAFGLDPCEYYCCGYFDDFDLGDDGDCMTFWVESGNSPCEDLIDAILNYYEGRVTVLWFVECPDDGAYWTNDREGRVFSSRYEVDLEDIDIEWFETIPQAVEWIKEKTGVVIPENIAADVNSLYDYIVYDLGEILGMYCNFHWVDVVDEG